MTVLLWEFWQAKKNHKKPKKSTWKFDNKSFDFLTRPKSIQIDLSFQGSEITLGNF